MGVPDDLSALDFPTHELGSDRDYVVGDKGTGKTDLLRLVVTQVAERTGEQVRVIATPEHAASWSGVDEAQLVVTETTRMIAGRLRGAGDRLVVVQLPGAGPGSIFLPEMRMALAERAGYARPFIVSARVMHRALAAKAQVWRCETTQHDGLPASRWVTHSNTGFVWPAPAASRARTS